MIKAEISSSPLDCCFSAISSESAFKKNNLFSTSQLDNCENLLFLYRWIESNGKNLNFYPNVISVIKEICPTLQCCDVTENTSDVANFRIKLVCSDDILADSFIIYT